MVLPGEPTEITMTTQNFHEASKPLFPRNEEVTRRFTEEHKDLMAKVITKMVEDHGDLGPTEVPFNGDTFSQYIEEFGFSFDPKDTRANALNYFNFYVRKPSKQLLRRLSAQTIYDLNVIRTYRWGHLGETDLESIKEFQHISSKRSTSKVLRWYQPYLAAE